MAVVLGVLKGIDQTYGVLAFPLLDCLKELVGQMGEIFSFACPIISCLDVKLGAEPGKLIDKLFLGNLSILKNLQDALKCLVHGCF